MAEMAAGSCDSEIEHLLRGLNGRRFALLIVGLAGCSSNLGWLAG
jgi:hypothetical protein